MHVVEVSARQSTSGVRHNLLRVSLVPTMQPNNIPFLLRHIRSSFVIIVADSSLNLLWQYFGNPAAKHLSFWMSLSCSVKWNKSPPKEALGKFETL